MTGGMVLFQGPAGRANDAGLSVFHQSNANAFPEDAHAALVGEAFGEGVAYRKITDRGPDAASWPNTVVGHGRSRAGVLRDMGCSFGSVGRLGSAEIQALLKPIDNDGPRQDIIDDNVVNFLVSASQHAGMDWAPRVTLEDIVGVGIKPQIFGAAVFVASRHGQIVVIRTLALPANVCLDTSGTSRDKRMTGRIQRRPIVGMM